MPKQIFDVYDFLGPLVAALVFALVLLFLSFFLLNFLFIRKDDEITVFEKFGLKHNVRLGPHSLRSIKLIQRNGLHSYNEEGEQQQEQLKQKYSYMKPIPLVKIDAASITNEVVEGTSNS